MNTIDKIKEQIRTSEITFFQSDQILDEYDKYDVKNINHLTCAIIQNYLYEKILFSDFGDLFFRYLDFRTTNGEYMEFDELIENNEQSSSFYYTMETAYYSTPIQIDVDIPTYDENENYENYIKELFKDIKRKTTQVVNNFNPEKLFNDLYVPREGDDPKIVLYNLNKAKDTFLKLLNEIE